MAGPNTYSDISQRTAAWAATEMLAHAEPILVLSKFGMMKPVPKNTSEQVKFRRPVPYTVSTVPLAEGVTPTAHAHTYVDVTANLQQYGDVTEITDKIEDMSEDPVLKDMSMLSGEQAAETIELVIYGEIKGGTNVIYSNGTARNQVNTVIGLDDVRTSVRFIQAQRGKMITSMLGSGTGFNTTPIEAGYIAFGHTDFAPDIRDMPGFVPCAEYGSRSMLCPQEIGTVENIRFILSPLFAPWADAGTTASTNDTKTTTGTNADVYPMLVCSKDAWGQVPLKGSNSIKPMVLRPNVARGGDPLGQVGSVGWKTFYTAKILNDAWMVRIEAGVSALKTVA